MKIKKLAEGHLEDVQKEIIVSDSFRQVSSVAPEAEVAHADMQLDASYSGHKKVILKKLGAPPPTPGGWEGEYEGKFGGGRACMATR